MHPLSIPITLYQRIAAFHFIQHNMNGIGFFRHAIQNDPGMARSIVVQDKFRLGEMAGFRVSPHSVVFQYKPWVLLLVNHPPFI